MPADLGNNWCCGEAPPAVIHKRAHRIECSTLIYIDTWSPLRDNRSLPFALKAAFGNQSSVFPETRPSPTYLLKHISLSSEARPAFRNTPKCWKHKETHWTVFKTMNIQHGSEDLFPLWCHVCCECVDNQVASCSHQLISIGLKWAGCKRIRSTCQKSSADSCSARCAACICSSQAHGNTWHCHVIQSIIRDLGHVI